MNKKQINSIITNCQNYEYIYFDCFDTLIKRKFSINYVFYKLSDMLIIEYNFPVDHNSLFNILINFFSRCDINFSTIVSDIYLHYKKYITSTFQQFSDNFTKTFIDSEIENIQLNGDICYLLSQLKSKNLYVISDYYLGEDVLITYFKKLLGYNPFKKIFVSCDVKAKKSNGTIYEMVKFPNKSIMIGDNKNSDILQASKFGMKTFLVNSNANYYKYNIFDLTYNKNCEKYLYSNRNKNWKTYASNFSFSLFLFCKKLYSRLEVNDTVYFLSRDGYFLKKCFDEYLVFNKNLKNLKTEYFHVSRLSMFLPTLNTNCLTYNYIKSQLLQRTQWTLFCLNDFLNCLGFSEQEKENFSNKNIKYKNFLETNECKSLFDSPMFISILKNKINDSKKRFHYLTRNINKKFITVDLGWKGIQQNDMRKVLPKNIKIIGYYFGTTRSVGEFKNSDKTGIIFDHSLDNNKLLNFLSIETLLKNNEPQIISYSMNGDIYMEDNTKEIYTNYSQICQNKAYNLFKLLCTYNVKYPISYNSLDNVIEKIHKKKSIKSMVYENYYYNFQNQNYNSKRTFKHYIRAIGNKAMNNIYLSKAWLFIYYKIYSNIK